MGEAETLLGPKMVIASTILDGQKPIWPGSMPVANESQARQAVRKVKRDGYDFVKVYSLLPREAYFAISTRRRSRDFNLQDTFRLRFRREKRQMRDKKVSSISHVLSLRALLAQKSWVKGSRMLISIRHTAGDSQAPPSLGR